MDPGCHTQPHPPTHQLDALVALMQDNPAIRDELLAAGSAQELRTSLHRLGLPLEGDQTLLDPELLREAFRCG